MSLLGEEKSIIRLWKGIYLDAKKDIAYLRTAENRAKAKELQLRVKKLKPDLMDIIKNYPVGFFKNKAHWKRINELIVLLDIDRVNLNEKWLKKVHYDLQDVLYFIETGKLHQNFKLEYLKLFAAEHTLKNLSDIAFNGAYSIIAAPALLKDFVLVNSQLDKKGAKAFLSHLETESQQILDIVSRMFGPVWTFFNRHTEEIFVGILTGIIVWRITRYFDSKTVKNLTQELKATKDALDKLGQKSDLELSEENKMLKEDITSLKKLVDATSERLVELRSRIMDYVKKRHIFMLERIAGIKHKKKKKEFAYLIYAEVVDLEKVLLDEGKVINGKILESIREIKSSCQNYTK